ncbi:MAG: hypothetical protein ACRCXL_15180 [Dermatophilaceae bacterium]
MATEPALTRTTLAIPAALEPALTRTTLAIPAALEPTLTRTTLAIPATAELTLTRTTLAIPAALEPALTRTTLAIPAALEPALTRTTLTSLAASRTAFRAVAKSGRRGRARRTPVGVPTLVAVAASRVGHPRLTVTDRSVAALATGTLVVRSIRRALVAPGATTVGA